MASTSPLVFWSAAAIYRVIGGRNESARMKGHVPHRTPTSAAHWRWLTSAIATLDAAIGCFLRPSRTLRSLRTGDAVKSSHQSPLANPGLLADMAKRFCGDQPSRHLHRPVDQTVASMHLPYVSIRRVLTELYEQWQCLGPPQPPWINLNKAW